MDNYQRTIIQDCFDGAIERECENCPNHPGAGGTCCFGSKHDYQDSECRQCRHEKDCIYITRGYSAQPRPPMVNGRPMAFQQPPQRVPVYGVPPQRIPIRTNQQPLHHPSPVIPSLAMQTRAPMIPALEGPEGPFLERLGRITVWGMIEGGLQMALDYFQLNRPR